MDATKALKSTIDGFNEAISNYISRLPIDGKISSTDNQITFAMIEGDNLLAMKHVKKIIELLLIKINDKHCDDSR
jgi:hypothetical protein